MELAILMETHRINLDRLRESANFDPEHAVIWGAIESGLFATYPCMAEFEWCPTKGRTDLGKGDAVFVTKSRDRALVVEAKALHEVRYASFNLYE